MSRKVFILSAVVSALVLQPSCSQREPEQETDARFKDIKPKTTTAVKLSVSGENTAKTHLENNNVWWDAGDVIGVFDSPHDATTYPGGHQFTCSTGGSSSVTFSGDLDARSSKWFAVYPYSHEDTFDYANGTLTLSVPSSQTISQIGSMAPGSSPSVGVSTDCNHMTMRNVSAHIRLNIGEFIQSVMVSAWTDKAGTQQAALSGKITVRPNSSGGVDIVSVPNSGSVIISPTGNAATSNGCFRSGSYDISVIPRSGIEKISFTFKRHDTSWDDGDNEQSVVTSTAYSITLEASKFATFGTPDNLCEWNTYALNFDGNWPFSQNDPGSSYVSQASQATLNSRLSQTQFKLFGTSGYSHANNALNFGGSATNDYMLFPALSSKALSNVEIKFTSAPASDPMITDASFSVLPGGNSPTKSSLTYIWALSGTTIGGAGALKLTGAEILNIAHIRLIYTDTPTEALVITDGEDGYYTAHNEITLPAASVRTNSQSVVGDYGFVYSLENQEPLIGQSGCSIASSQMGVTIGTTASTIPEAKVPVEWGSTLYYRAFAQQQGCSCIYGSVHTVTIPTFSIETVDASENTKANFTGDEYATLNIMGNAANASTSQNGTHLLFEYGYVVTGSNSTPAATCAKDILAEGYLSTSSSPILTNTYQSNTPLEKCIFAYVHPFLMVKDFPLAEHPEGIQWGTPFLATRVHVGDGGQGGSPAERYDGHNIEWVAY